MYIAESSLLLIHIMSTWPTPVCCGRHLHQQAYIYDVLAVLTNRPFSNVCKVHCLILSIMILKMHHLRAPRRLNGGRMPGGSIASCSSIVACVRFRSPTAVDFWNRMCTSSGVFGRAPCSADDWMTCCLWKALIQGRGTTSGCCFLCFR